jgi:hypothetical protein
VHDELVISGQNSSRSATEALSVRREGDVQESRCAPGPGRSATGRASRDEGRACEDGTKAGRVGGAAKGNTDTAASSSNCGAMPASPWRLT